MTSLVIACLWPVVVLGSVVAWDGLRAVLVPRRPYPLRTGRNLSTVRKAGK